MLLVLILVPLWHVTVFQLKQRKLVAQQHACRTAAMLC